MEPNNKLFIPTPKATRLSPSRDYTATGIFTVIQRNQNLLWWYF
jgi:hypothetical protein